MLPNGASRPRIRGLSVRALELPMARPVQMSGRVISSAPMVLIDVLTEDGVTGSSYLLSYVKSALNLLLSSLSIWRH
jgi:mandelate racemase